MDGDGIDGRLHSFQRSVILWIDWYPLKLVQSVPAIYHLPKHCVPWRKNDWMFHQNFKPSHLRSKDGCGAYVRNHWLPLEFGPELAIESTPLVLCFKSSLISSWYKFWFKQYQSGEDLIQTWNFPPQMLSPPFPVFVGSPVCTMKPCRGDIVKILKWIQDPPRFNFITLMFLVNMQLL